MLRTKTKIQPSPNIYIYFLNLNATKDAFRVAVFSLFELNPDAFTSSVRFFKTSAFTQVQFENICGVLDPLNGPHHHSLELFPPSIHTVIDRSFLTCHIWHVRVERFGLPFRSFICLRRPLSFKPSLMIVL